MPTIGRYEVVKELGRGAMGVVYLANDPHLQRQVAVKTYHLPEGISDELAKEFRERFLREARAAASLSHPGIVTVHDAGQDPATGRPFIAMEYIPGESLSQRLKRPLERAWVLEMGGILADALQAAHRAGIVHRDIKPANILIREPDGAAKIADFGVARLKESNLTQSGASIGSPGYMSPEQVRGGALDGRSDLFSLAVVLYEALCGKRPFRGDDLVSLAYSIAHDTQIPLSRQQPGTSAELDRFFDRALSKDPEQRFPDGASFKQAFLAAGKEKPVAAERTVLGIAPLSADAAGKREPRTQLARAETIPLAAASARSGQGLRALTVAGVALLSVGLAVAAYMRFVARPEVVQNDLAGISSTISSPVVAPVVKPAEQAGSVERSSPIGTANPSLSGSGLPRPEPPKSPVQSPSRSVAPKGNVEFTPQALKPPPKLMLSVPAGTQVTVELEHAVGSSNSTVGDIFTARFTRPVIAGDRVVIPAGSRIQGHVIESTPAKKGLSDKSGSLKLAFERLVTPSGFIAPMSASYATAGKTSKKKTAGAIGGGAAGGALLGKVLGGSSKDAVLGSVAGAAIGTGIAAGTKGQDVEIASG
ncbi:MAG TPA: protein kinase, partial [Candidatus Polarisedimenticolia bacterium]|nr:protein kinase [Candidatus Polarisedimenticolia bacterium]